MKKPKNPLDVLHRGFIPHHPIRNLARWFSCWRDVFERARKGFCHSDTYDLHSFLIPLLYASIAEYRKNAWEWPADFVNGIDEWREILDEILRNLQHLKDTKDDIWTPEARAEYDALCAKTFHLLGTYLPYMWW